MAENHNNLNENNNEPQKPQPVLKEGADEVKAKGSLLNEAFDWVESILIAVIAIILIFTFLVRVTSVDGSSMNPTLVDQERLLVTDLFYSPQYNDIVILQANGLINENGEYGKPIVKRVIGLPGDTINIDFDNGIVYRNGEALKLETIDGLLYEDGHTINDYTHNRLDFTGEVTVPAGCIFVLGDNRNWSTDSRSGLVGMVDENYIIGKAFFRITPFNKFGTIN